MSATLIADLTNQVGKYWAPDWKPELLETNILANVVSKEYEGDIKFKGDTVHSTQVSRPAADRKTTGSGNEYFSTSKLTTSRISIVADQTFSAAYEFETLAQLQTDLDKNESVIKNNLIEAMNIKLNAYLYSFVNATTPQSGVTDFNASELSLLRKFAGQKKWRKANPWYCLVDSSYHSDLLNAQTLTSTDHVADQPLVSGQIANKRYGFDIFEDNSDGLLSVIANEGGTDSEDVGVAFHPDFLHLAMQMQPEIEIASLTSNKQFGYIIVAKMIGGAALGHDSADLHQTIFNT